METNPMLNKNSNKDGKKVKSNESLNNPVSVPFSHTVREAVAIAAGKKESVANVDEDETKTSGLKSNMLCYFYWLLVVLILGLISFTVWLSIQLAKRHNSALNVQNGKYGDKDLFSFEDVFNASIKPKTFHVSWISDDIYVYQSNDLSLQLYDITNNSTEKLMDKSIFDQFRASEYIVSHDLKYILIKYDVKKLWQYSSLSHYVVYDKHVQPGNSRIHYLNDGQNNLYIQFAMFSPTGSFLLYAINNDLYFQSNVKSSVSRLTNNGNNEIIFNGVADWTYEKIFKRNWLVWWSADSRYICYISINNSLVAKHHYVDRTINSFRSIAYPRVYGQSPLPVVAVNLIDTEHLDKAPLVLLPPAELKLIEHYVFQVVWMDDAHVSIVWVNRAQNQSIISLYNAATASFYNVFYQTQTNGWLKPQMPIVFLPHGRTFLTILPSSDQSDSKNKENLLALVNMKDYTDSSISYLTNGSNEVLEIVAYNAQHEVFFLATNGDPKNKHLFKMSVWNPDSIKCISCNRSSECKYHSAQFSPLAKNYILGCLGPAPPYYKLRSQDSAIDMMVEDNKQLKQIMETKYFPTREFIEVPIGNNQKAWAEVLLPPEGKTKPYPFLLQILGDPDTQSVTEKFELGWGTYMAAAQEIVVVRLDGRGTEGRGFAYKSEIYRDVSRKQVEDLLLAGIYLKTLDYIENTKPAIWGWGFPGHLALQALANETDVFPCAISMGAILDKHFYDATFYERYMGFANDIDSFKGYQHLDLMNKAELIKNKKLMLVQGFAGDDIHFSSSIKFSNHLHDLNLAYQSNIYSDLSSYTSMTGEGSEAVPSKHALRSMVDFLKNECFSYYWTHDTKTWVVDKAVKKEKFRIKQFCV